MIPFSKPTIGQEEIDVATRVLQSGWLAASKETEAFEKEFAQYVGVKYAIFTNSCTSALKMAYKILKESGYNHFYYPENTYCATYSAGMELGLTPIPYNFKNKTEWKEQYIKCKVNVSYGGIKDETPCFIEDSAHRIEPNDPLVGKIRCYSFYATKNMTTGTGGMFVTDDKEIYDTARTYWLDGIDKSVHDRHSGGWDYSIITYAGGYDGNDIAAAIGREQLKKLPWMTERRNEIVNKYNEAFNQDWKGNHLYPYFVKKEEEISSLINYLADKGIQASLHYPKTGWLGVSLPIYPLLTEEEQNVIIGMIKGWENG